MRLNNNAYAFTPYSVRCPCDVTRKAGSVDLDWFTWVWAGFIYPCVTAATVVVCPRFFKHLQFDLGMTLIWFMTLALDILNICPGSQISIFQCMTLTQWPCYLSLITRYGQDVQPYQNEVSLWIHSKVIARTDTKTMKTLQARNVIKVDAVIFNCLISRQSIIHVMKTLVKSLSNKMRNVANWGLELDYTGNTKVLIMWECALHVIGQLDNVFQLVSFVLSFIIKRCSSNITAKKLEM